MPTIIKLIANYIDDLLFTSNNNIILIEKKNTSNGIEFKEYTNVNYKIIETLYKKEYYIETTYYDIYTAPLTKLNFIITLNVPNVLFDYVYLSQTIYFYYETINIPFNMIGLINYNQNIAVLVQANLLTIYDTIVSYFNVISFKNNNLLDTNIITLPGNIISINTFSILSTSIVAFNYYLFNTILPIIIIKDYTNIYIYDPTFIRIINIPIKIINLLSTDTINLLVELVGNSGSIIYSYITNLNINLVEGNSNTSNVISFYNYVKDDTISSVILRVFDYDYYIYFSELLPGDYIGCSQITLDKSDLYDILLKNNTNIPAPTIQNLSILDYNLYFSLSYLDNIFINNQNLSNRLNEEILLSTDERFNIVLNYLKNFKMMNYDIYDIKFKILTTTQNNIEQDDFKYRSYEINTNNLLLNSVLTNIEIYYTNLNSIVQNYNIYGMIFNNNNTWDTYTKKYSLDNPDNKYNLIKDLLIMSINYQQIIVYNYSDIDDLNSIKVPQIAQAGIIYVNNYWKYNRLVLDKNNSKMSFGLDQNYYLKMYFEIYVDYKMLIFYSDTLFSSSPTTKVLNFRTNALYNFKILQIANPNGSISPNQYVYSILFQNIDECNEFIYWIKDGITVIPPGKISSYFNFTKSKYFKLNSEGYYIESSTTSNTISFEIIDLNLYNGNVFTNNKIIYNI